MKKNKHEVKGAWERKKNEADPIAGMGKQSKGKGGPAKLRPPPPPACEAGDPGEQTGNTPV